MIKNNKTYINSLIENLKTGDINKLTGLQVNVEYLSYYTPSGANWSYRIGIAKIDGGIYEVVTVFGAIVGARQLYL